MALAAWYDNLELNGLLAPWQWEALLRLVLCVAIGGMVGLEREYHGRAAGLRTHVLVCLGCGLIMLVSTHFGRMYEHLTDESAIRVDPARVAYGVVTGIGFLGAGVIMKTGYTVHGLTTAASLWCSAALGLGIGVGMYVVTAGAALLMLFALTVMRLLGGWIPGHHYKHVRLLVASTFDLRSLKSTMKQAGARILNMRVCHNREAKSYEVRFRLRYAGWVDPIDLHEKLAATSEFELIEVR